MTRHLSWPNALWGVWLLEFLVYELWAVFANHNYTLSDTVWTLEGINLSQPFDFSMWTNTHWALAGLVWALLLWLSVHLPFGLLR